MQQYTLHRTTPLSIEFNLNLSQETKRKADEKANLGKKKYKNKYIISQ